MVDTNPSKSAPLGGAHRTLTVVGQAIENGACEAFRAEDLGPFIERQVGGDDDGAALVALRDDLEEKLGPGLAQWHKTQLINDQQVLADQLFLQALQAAFVDGLDEFMDESSGSGEAYFPALLAGRQTQSQGDMGFTWLRKKSGRLHYVLALAI